MPSKAFLLSGFPTCVWTPLMVESSLPFRRIVPFFWIQQSWFYLLKAAQRHIWEGFHNLATMSPASIWERPSMLAWLGTQLLEFCRAEFQFWPDHLHCLLMRLHVWSRLASLHCGFFVWNTAPSYRRQNWGPRGEITHSGFIHDE